MWVALLRVAADDLEGAVVVEINVVDGDPVVRLAICVDEAPSIAELVLGPIPDEEIGRPNTSVVAAGIVLICAAGTVTDFTGTPSDSAVFVFIQRHVGVSVGMKSPVVVSPNDALVYVTGK
jgi:hypothetical protein